MGLIPFFKSHYSVGKSILTLESPAKAKSGGADSIFSILKENNIDKFFLIDDTFSGFVEAYKEAAKNKIQLIYGISFNVNDDPNLEDRAAHRIWIFAKNSVGIKKLLLLYKTASKRKDLSLTSKDLESGWDNEALQLVIPYYDSLIFNNNLFFSECIFDFSKYLSPVFLIEKNGMIYDEILEKRIRKFASIIPSAGIELAKTICYKKKCDVDVLQTTKIISRRSFYKEQTLENDGLDDFVSNEFCWESFLEKNEH